jgi:DNA-binding Lrp family transcriptional regulator
MSGVDGYPILAAAAARRSGASSPERATMIPVGDGVDELDIALLDALHVNPQISFDELGRVLEVSPVTVARRWRRLVTTGRAWVSSAIGRRLLVRAAVFEAECEPGAAQAVALQLAAWPQVFSVNITTGQENLYALLVAADQPLLAELLVDVLPAVPGLRRVQTALITQLFSGTQWRLGGLSSGQVRAVTPEPTTTEQVHAFDEFDRELFRALQHDGRLTYRDLAAAVGRSEPVVRRRVDLLTRTGLLAFRTDFARVEAGWLTAVAVKLRVGLLEAAAVGRTLVQYSETRFCVATVGGGAADLFVTMQLHKLSDLGPVMKRLLAAHPGVAVLDTRVVLRSVKSFGRLLGPEGRAEEVVPVDPWAPANQKAQPQPVASLLET